MKKLITIILILALLLPAAALASNPAGAPKKQEFVRVETPNGNLEVRDIVKQLDYDNLLKLNDMIDEYLIDKSGKTAFDIKVESLSYEELIQLKDRLNLAMWNSESWQEVTVPEGVWEVGKDIPEGHWSIRLAVENQLSNITYTDSLDEYGKDVTWGWKGWHGSICNKKNKDGSLKWPEYPEEADIDMKAGMYFINKMPVIFTPYTGKPDLGFK